MIHLDLFCCFAYIVLFFIPKKKDGAKEHIKITGRGHTNHLNLPPNMITLIKTQKGAIFCIENLQIKSYIYTQQRIHVEPKHTRQQKKRITKSMMIGNLEFYPRTAQHYLDNSSKNKAFPKQGDVFGRLDPTNPPQRGMDWSKKASTDGSGSQIRART